MADVSGDLVLPPARGRPGPVVVPAAELVERFSRSSGPGGQSVNTADSRVELRYDVAHSGALAEWQRERVLTGLGPRLLDGVIVITASEHRSQRQNRVAARARLASLLTTALQPPSPSRRPTRPTRSSKEKRLEGKKRRATVKQGRGPVPPER